MTELIRILVRGRVQGVGFRHFTALQARRLGIAGWVRNTDDGAVEVLASAPPGPRERFLAALRRGPPASVVDDVQVSPADPSQQPAEPGFHVRH